MSKYIVRQYTYTDENGATQTLNANEAQQGTSGGPTGQRWWTCAQCRYDYPEDQFMFYGGVPYCIPNGCYEEHEE